MNPIVRLGGVDNSAKVLRDVGNLSHLQVYVGIPESKAARNNNKGRDMTNAQLAFLLTNGVRSAGMRAAMAPNMKHGYTAAHAMYLHTHGSPLWRTPPRPIIEPAIEARGNREPICVQLKKAAQAVLDGDKAGAVRGLHLAGQEAENRVRNWFTDSRNNWPPNAPSTIRRKGSSRPNIDTEQLRKAITHVVEGL